MAKRLNIPLPVASAKLRCDAEVTLPRPDEWALKGGRPGGRQIRRPQGRAPTVLRAFGQADSGGNPAAEKSIVVSLHCSYPKPTQVGEERILRCSSNSWLRN